MTKRDRFKYFKTSPEIIRLAVMMYVRYPLSLRTGLSWRMSNTMHADFCMDALNKAIVKYGLPEIMNADQGSQFSGAAGITKLPYAGVRI